MKKWSTPKLILVYLLALTGVLLLLSGAMYLLLGRRGESADAIDRVRMSRAEATGEDRSERGRRPEATEEDDSKGRGRRPTEETETTDAPTPAARISSGSQDRIVREPLVTLRGDGSDTTTVMILLNGSNLESDYGFATADIGEMLDAASGDQLNILIETVGTRRWQRYDIASDHSQRYEIRDQELILVDDSLGQMDCTVSDTLLDFITWSVENYPADRYFLILWDHGGGSVDGYGYDQWQSYYDSLTMDEMYSALARSGVVFDFIGMDACIMSSIEICYALYPFCDYCILSEDFESAMGWDYTGWLSALAEKPSIDTLSLATILIDDMVEANRRGRYGSSSTLALIDERYIPSVFNSWMDFAFANEETLLSVNYSREVERTGRALPLPSEVSADGQARVSSELVEYYITDACALAVSVDSPYSKPFVAKLSRAVAYYNCTDDDIGLTGLSVTLPYEDSSFYHSLGQVYSGIGIQKRYIEWLGKFQERYVPTEYYDYGEFDEDWNGWEDIRDDD